MAIEGATVSTSSRSTKPFWITWCLYLLIMELVPMVFLAHVHVPEKSDFSCFYTAGVLVRSEPSHLYDPATQRALQAKLVGPANGWAMFIQPPYEAMFLAPFSLLPYRVSYFVYLAFNLALLIPCFFLARDAFSNVIDTWQPQPGLLFFFFLPLWLALLQGQASIRLLVVCCAVWYELRHGKDFAAGAVLALALFKMQIVIPLAVLLAVWRGWRLLLGFIAGSALLGGIGLWLVGVQGTEAFLKLLVASSMVKSETLSEIAASGQLPKVMPNLRGLLYGLGGQYLPHLLLLCLTLAASGLLFLWVSYLLRKEQDEAAAFGVAVIGALLLSYHLHTHDFTLLLLAVALLAAKTRTYFSFLVTTSFILPAVLLFFFKQSHFLLAIPLLGFTVLVSRSTLGQSFATKKLELAR